MTTTIFFDHKDAENLFWKLIGEAGKSQEKFHELIFPFTLEQLRAYQEEFFKVALWTESQLIITGNIEGNDSLLELCLYTISQGYSHYQQALSFPENFLLNRDLNDSQILYYTINQVIEDKYQTYFFDYTNPSNRFWRLIEDAQGSNEKFHTLIYSLSLDELEAYKRMFIQAQDELWTIDYPKELDIDSFLTNLFFHVVSQGYKYYQKILQEISKLPLNIKKTDLKNFHNIITQVINDKYSAELFDHTNPKNKFWTYIEISNSNKRKFYETISSLSLEALKSYEEEFDKAEKKLWTNDHYEAMGNVTSMDNFDDTRRYVVSQGYDYYIDILRNPKKLPRGIDDGNPKLLHGAILSLMMDKYEDY